MKAPPRRSEGRDRDRRRIALEAVRLLESGAAHDPADARDRAAHQLRVRDPAAQPTLVEIDRLWREHQQLFRPGAPPDALRSLRAAALPAMRLFNRFEPRLVGAVLAGTASANSPIELHLHSDEPESVARALIEAGIPAQSGSRRIRLDRTRATAAPTFAFLADEHPFELTVLPLTVLRQAPLDADGRALARATQAQVEALLATSAIAAPDANENAPR